MFFVYAFTLFRYGICGNEQSTFICFSVSKMVAMKSVAVGPGCVFNPGASAIAPFDRVAAAALEPSKYILVLASAEKLTPLIERMVRECLSRVYML